MYHVLEPVEVLTEQFLFESFFVQIGGGFFCTFMLLCFNAIVLLCREHPRPREILFNLT